jgi:hypothetical protein
MAFGILTASILFSSASTLDTEKLNLVLDRGEMSIEEVKVDPSGDEIRGEISMEEVEDGLSMVAVLSAGLVRGNLCNCTESGCLRRSQTEHTDFLANLLFIFR